MLKPGVKRVLAFIDTKGGIAQKVAFFLSIFPQAIALFFNYDSIIANPVYLILLIVSSSILILFCGVVFIIKRKSDKDEKPSIYVDEVKPARQGYKYHYSQGARIGVGLVMVAVVIVTVWFIIKIKEKPSVIALVEENCNAVIIEKSWLNAGAFVNVTTKDTSYPVRAARIIPGNKPMAAAEFKGLDCALDITLAPADSVDTLTVYSIDVEVDKYVPLPKYKGETSEKKYLKQDSVYVLTLYDPSSEKAQQKRDVKLIAGESIKDFSPLHIPNGQACRLLLRVNAEKQGNYTFKIKLKLYGNNRPECEMYLIDNIQWLFIK